MSLNVLTSAPEGAEKVLSREALAFLESLHRQFEPRRQELLAAPRRAPEGLRPRGDAGLPSCDQAVRGGDWKVAPTPTDLQRR